MKKLFISIIAVVCCMTASAVGAQPIAGDGSKACPYQIATLENLLWFAENVNSDKNHASTCAILTADITMNEGVLDSYGNLNSGSFEAWTPIGNDVELYFGEFNGNGHTISGLYLENTGANNKQHQARVEATCLTDGNIEYWHCPDCNTYFTDEACTASATGIAIAALGHDFTYTPYRTSTCTSEGDVEHWHCNRCGKDFNTGEEMASEDHVISGSLKIPCKESDAIVVGMDNGKIYDDCHTFTPPEAGEGETTIATVTLGEGVISMKIKNGEETAYSLNETKPLETFFAHTFTLTANQDPDHIENYYSTFYTSECAYKLPASVKAYIGTVGKYGGANVLNLTKTDTIHAGEAVILRAQPANTADKQTGITLMPSCNRRLASKDNKLTGTDVAVDALGPDDYALTLGQKGVGFYNWSGRPLGAHKAYLRWSGSKITSSGSFGFVFDDGTVTGIGSQEIPFVPDATGTYNLSGIPVDDSYDGIVIKDGKKYISNGPM